MKNNFYIYLTHQTDYYMGQIQKEPQVDARTNSINKTLNKIEEKNGYSRKKFLVI